MNHALWLYAATGLLAVAHLAAGVSKLALGQARLAERHAWARRFSGAQVAAIGVYELLAAAALSLPPLVGLPTVLVPAAATGLIVLHVIAAGTHLSLGERKTIVVNLTLIALALVVIWGRILFAPFPT